MGPRTAALAGVALDANGNGLATISALLGHTPTAVTSKVDTHMLKGADRTAVDSRAAALFVASDDDDENSVTKEPEAAQNRDAPG